MKKLGVSTVRLMQESEAYIQAFHNESGTGPNSICDALFDNPKTYCQWESAHFQLMKSVAENLRADSETLKLRKACFSLIHRKALFEYLRNNKVVGAERVAVFNSIFGPLDYTNAVVAEHGRFLRSTWSLLCADHLESSLLNDQTFVAELPDYQAAYADYFSLYCGRIIADVRGNDYPLEPLIGQMKHVAAGLQGRLMALPLAREHPKTVSPARDPATSGQYRHRERRYYC